MYGVRCPPAPAARSGGCNVLILDDRAISLTSEENGCDKIANTDGVWFMFP